LLEVANISHNAWYHKPAEKDTLRKDLIMPIIHEILTELPYYGYKRVTSELKDRGLTVNHKFINKIMKSEGLLQVKKKMFTPKTTNSNHKFFTYQNLIKDIPVYLPYQIWVSDVTYIKINNRFAYVALVLDIGLHKIVGFAISWHNDTELVKEALMMALREVKILPEYHHSDRGSTYCSFAYVSILKENNITISMADVGMSVDNAYAESLNGRLKMEEVYLSEYYDIHDARQSITKYIKQYNEKRIHTALGMSPLKFEQQLLERKVINDD
jgi:putative transposase